MPENDLSKRKALLVLNDRISDWLDEKIPETGIRVLPSGDRISNTLFRERLWDALADLSQGIDPTRDEANAERNPLSRLASGNTSLTQENYLRAFWPKKSDFGSKAEDRLSYDRKCTTVSNESKKRQTISEAVSHLCSLSGVREIPQDIVDIISEMAASVVEQSEIAPKRPKIHKGKSGMNAMRSTGLNEGNDSATTSAASHSMKEENRRQALESGNTRV